MCIALGTSNVLHQGVARFKVYRAEVFVEDPPKLFKYSDNIRNKMFLFSVCGAGAGSGSFSGHSLDSMLFSFTAHYRIEEAFSYLRELVSVRVSIACQM